MLKTTKNLTPFKGLELQLQLEEVEERWEEIKDLYTNTPPDQKIDTSEAIKITVEKIRILTELYGIYDFEA